MATDVISVGSKISQLDSSEKFYPLSKVKFILDNEGRSVQYGTNTGRSIEADNPFAGQLPPIANRWFSQTLVGLSYQPYTADGTLLNPAAEIGDAANMSGVYGGIYNRKVIFSPLMKANLAAPTDEEINHEYKFESQERREYSRIFGEVKASLIIQAGEIEAKVAKESPDGQTSFRWSLTDEAHKWYANNSATPVMEVNASGLIVRGEVNATSGVIGGFTIGSTAIYNGVTSMTDTDHSSGVYVGTNGIKLGQRFKVDSSGNVTASNMSLMGNLNFYNADGTLAGSMSAATLRQGAQDGYNWSNGDYNGSGMTPGQYSLGGAGGGYRFNRATNSGSGDYPSFFRSQILRATSTLTVDNSFVLRDSTIGKSSMIVLGDGGSTQIIRYLSW